MHNKQTNKLQASICFYKHNFYDLTMAFCDSTVVWCSGWAPESLAHFPSSQWDGEEKLKKLKKKHKIELMVWNKSIYYSTEKEKDNSYDYVYIYICECI